jgi:hypothetical protein
MDILVLTLNLKSKGALAGLTDPASLGSHARRPIQAAPRLDEVALSRYTGSPVGNLDRASSRIPACPVRRAGQECVSARRKKSRFA